MVPRTGGLHFRRWGLGFVHRSRTSLCRPVPNPSVTIRNVLHRCRTPTEPGHRTRCLRIPADVRARRTSLSTALALAACWSPRGELSASPSELLASPSKLLASPSELSASPSGGGDDSGTATAHSTEESRVRPEAQSATPASACNSPCEGEVAGPLLALRGGVRGGFVTSSPSPWSLALTSNQGGTRWRQA
jgi:hypothetical protein